MTKASVVIVGGGVMGASAAYHLAARGVRDVVVLDRAASPGAGSTGRATGGFRAQFSTDVQVRLSLLAREKLARFESETGVDPGYRPFGYLWLASSEAQRDDLRRALAVQRAAGLHEAREVSAGEIAALNPAVRLDGVIGGCFCPTDGFVAPMKILEGYLGAAERLGVRVEWNTTVTALERSGERIVRVVTSNETIEPEQVIDAAGPWAAPVAALAGVSVPVTPLRRQVAATTPTTLLPSDMPMTIFAGDGFHFRVRDGRILLLYATPGVPGRPFDASVDPEWVAMVTAIARQRIRGFDAAEIDPGACHAGLYEMSPDRHAILGRAPECENLWLINGSSGHGVMHSPALGQLLAEILLDGAASMDVTSLAPGRFAEQRLNASSELL